MLFAVLLALAAYGYAEATATPQVVRYCVRAPGWHAAPLTIALIADTHMDPLDMRPARLARIADQVSALHPDLILMAGDYLGRRVDARLPVSPREAIAPFARLHARLGVFAVLGNHDMGMREVETPGLDYAVTSALARAGVHVLRNAAARIGDIWIAGVDDNEFGHPDVDRALAQVPPGAALIFVVHNPDLIASLPARRVALAVAGHTHGGQIAPFGFVYRVPIHHPEWLRGLASDRGMPLIVTSGVGTSHVPFRIGVPPEIVLIRLQGAAATPAAGISP